MTRGQRRRRLSFSWWQQLLLTLLPLVLVIWLFGKSEPLLPELAMPLFIAGVASMFVTLRTFGPYKHGLINLQKALDTAQEPAAWDALARARQRCLGAGPDCGKFATGQGQHPEPEYPVA